MTQPGGTGSALATALYGYRIMQNDGSPLPQRGTLNVVGGGTFVDNSGNDSTDLTITTTGEVTTTNSDWVTTAGQASHGQKTSRTTSNNTTATIDTVAIPDEAVTSIYVIVSAFQSSAPDMGEWQYKGIWYRSAAGVPTVKKAFTAVDSNPNATGTTWTVTALVSGNNVLIQVTGDTGKTISWTCTRCTYEGA